jgi:hypothetical protein
MVFLFSKSLNGSSSYGYNDENFDENLPIINKTKHSTKGERKRYKMEGPKS